MIELLEGRLMLSAPVVGFDGGATFGSAAPLGKLSGALVVNNALSSGESSDFFQFSVRWRGNVNVTLAGLSANANLRLFDANGKQLAISAQTRTRPEAISQSLRRGTYGVSVDRGKLAADTNYTLSLQADLNFEKVQIDGTSYTLGLKRADGTSAAISTHLETWVVIHGWQSTPAATHPLATAINAASTHLQVLELDWSQVADSQDAVWVVLHVPDVGAWAAGKLAGWGIPNLSLNLIGHSFGGYMTDQIAKDISGGVNRIVALDPATAALGGIDFSGTDFAAHSRYSIAFIGSDYGTLSAAQTADETINADVGRRSTFATHGAVRDLFTSMTEQNNTGHHDNISPLFSLKAIGSSSARPFLKDGMGDGYEAILAGRQSGGQWVPGTLTYKDAATKKIVSITA